MLITIRNLKDKLPLKYRSSVYHILTKLPILPKEVNGVNYMYDIRDIGHELIVRNTRSKKVEEVIKLLLKAIDEELAKERDNTICGVPKQDRENNL